MSNIDLQIINDKLDYIITIINKLVPPSEIDHENFKEKPYLSNKYEQLKGK